jgi:AcrR family transcriptional regulator
LSKESKKDLIANTALTCFISSGYGGTSVDEIVRTSGVSKGGIYWHFKSKEDIFLYLVERWINDGINEYISSLMPSDSAAEKLTKYIEHYLNNIDTPVTALILEFVLQAKDLEIMEKLHNFSSKSLSVLGEIIETAIKKGEFCPLEPTTTTQVFFYMIDGIGHQLLIHKDKKLLEKTLRSGLAIFLKGVL